MMKLSDIKAAFTSLTTSTEEEADPLAMTSLTVKQQAVMSAIATAHAEDTDATIINIRELCNARLPTQISGPSLGGVMSSLVRRGLVNAFGTERHAVVSFTIAGRVYRDMILDSEKNRK